MATAIIGAFYSLGGLFILTMRKWGAAMGVFFIGAEESVSHRADEYVRGDVHTNTVENFYSVFKRGMKGVYQHCS